ncbi:hypothetical protein M9434_007224 [Picochlorum sp. BPE23]|nr:hypothetical protein M9434_007224 [Picochlorum sp. BPE23]
MARRCEKCSLGLRRKRDRRSRNGVTLCRACYDEEERPSGSVPRGGSTQLLQRSSGVASTDQLQGRQGEEGRPGRPEGDVVEAGPSFQPALSGILQRFRAFSQSVASQVTHSVGVSAGVEGALAIEGGSDSRPPVPMDGSIQTERRSRAASADQQQGREERGEGITSRPVVEAGPSFQPPLVELSHRYDGIERFMSHQEVGRQGDGVLFGSTAGDGSDLDDEPVVGGQPEVHHPPLPLVLDGGAGFRWLQVYKRDLLVGAAAASADPERRATLEEIRTLHRDGELYNSREELLQPMRSLNIEDLHLVNNEVAEEQCEIVTRQEERHAPLNPTDDDGFAIRLGPPGEHPSSNPVSPTRVRIAQGEKLVFEEVKILRGVDRWFTAPDPRPKYYRVYLPTYIIGPHERTGMFFTVPSWAMSFSALSDAQSCVIFHRAFCTAVENKSLCNPQGEQQPWHLSVLERTEGVEAWMVTRFESSVESVLRDLDLLFNEVYGRGVENIPLPESGPMATPCEIYLMALCRLRGSSFFDETDASLMRTTYVDWKLRHQPEERRAHICLGDLWRTWWSLSPDDHDHDRFELLKMTRTGAMKPCVLRGGDILRLLTREFVDLYDACRSGGSNKPNATPLGPYIFHQTVFQRQTE